jgi:rRNA maturation protein Nop10
VAPPPPNLAEVKSWFSDEELQTCPQCGAHAVVPPEATVAVCLACGEVAAVAGPTFFSH